jgi:hypothetical protein
LESKRFIPADKNISLYERRIDVTIGALVNEVRELANTVAKNPVISSRIKNPQILEKKMHLKGVQDVFLIDDVWCTRCVSD